MDKRITQSRKANNRRVFSLALGALSLTATASAESFQLQLSSASAGLIWNGTPGKFNGSPVTLTVNTDVRSWRLFAVLNPVSGPDGAIGGTAFTLTPAVAGSVSGLTSFATTASNLLGQREIARGSAMSGATIGSINLAASIPALTHPGAAVASLTFLYQRTDIPGQPLVPVANLNLGFNVESFVTATVSDDPFGFSVQKFGDQLTPTKIPVIVTTNIPSGAQVSVSLGAVRSNNATIPAERLAILFAAANSPALANPMSVPLGTATLAPFYLGVPYGTTTCYARGKISASFEDKPGTYNGTLTFTVTSS